jgi:hypothetical protein
VTIKKAADVLPGERVRLASGREMTVSRIVEQLLGRDDLLCFVEDTNETWFAHGVRVTAEADVIRPMM